MLVLIDEISALEKSLLSLPWSNRDKLNDILFSLTKEPSNTDTIEQWAKTIHVSPRTLARMFQKELGMTFTEWRMRVKLFYAIEQLHDGKSVTYIALELGYSTPSAFIAAFRKIMGKSPLEYITV
ncbi:helix-turn-helix transcriptional regulator [Moritella sp. 5]|uniref:helix-turn-helix transcriptional regulator n=1 Tax=Moritella sp. 5 TaxID=2746231 RepID=UPI001BAB8348|nr:helix-turn-helix transcriptional regulator [Moritella sp. 5]QUM80523.1 helix-turn-helix transcriptional regulator [Moritella sp. 5]